MEATDQELMARLVLGDDLALNELMTRWRSPIASFLYRMTTRVDTAADLAQETFVKLYQIRHRYRPEAKFSTFLFAIANNLARNQARWNRGHPTVSLDQDPEDAAGLMELVDPGQTPHEAAISAERNKAILHAFRELPADLREAMSLFIYEDMSYAEISHIVGCSPKAAETRIYRARQILKDRLKLSLRQT
jgi:RNA polymerase sigma-70 factor (ECF subfamily)